MPAWLERRLKCQIQKLLSIYRVTSGPRDSGTCGALAATGGRCRNRTTGPASASCGHEACIEDFFDTAVKQDIERRIRFADDFGNLPGKDKKPAWTEYLEDLKRRRTDSRTRINDLEAALVDLKQVPEAERDVAAFDRTVRELGWAYGEIGCAPLNRSVVTGTMRKKERLCSSPARRPRSRRRRRTMSGSGKRNAGT